MYLIIGGSGYLGRYCIKNILEKTDDNILATYSKQEISDLKSTRLKWVELDVSNIDAMYEIAKIVDNNTKIIFLAAYHHPDKVDENQEYAWKINIISLANAVNLFSKAKCLYYSSTDTVYGEGNIEHKFLETDLCKPLNLYGKHKLLAEQIVITKGFNVVRFPFIFGPSLINNKPHFFDNIKNDLQHGKKIEMFSDSYRSTLSFNQCSNFLIDIIESGIETKCQIFVVEPQIHVILLFRSQFYALKST